MSDGYSCWDGWELTGKVRDTILRGSVLVEDEESSARRPAGGSCRGRCCRRSSPATSRSPPWLCRAHLSRGSTRIRPASRVKVAAHGIRRLGTAVVETPAQVVATNQREWACSEPTSKTPLLVASNTANAEIP